MFIIKTKADKQRVIDHINAMPLYPVQYVDIFDYVKNRTKAQSRTFHKWVKVISDYTGYKPREVKDKLVLTLWEPIIRVVRVRRNGAWVEFNLADRLSTADLTVSEMSDLMDVTSATARELGLELPMPEDFKNTY